MKYSRLIKITMLTITFIGVGFWIEKTAYAAPNFLEQLPFSQKTDPDHHRPNGYCNDDNACAPGWYCSSFGRCEIK